MYCGCCLFSDIFVETWQPFRFYTALIRFGAKLYLTNSELEKTAALESTAFRHVSVMNDIYSWEREWEVYQANPTDGTWPFSAIYILANETGLPYTACKRLMYSYCRELELALKQSTDEIRHNRMESLSYELEVYIKGLEYFMCGIELWSQWTPRYRQWGLLFSGSGLSWRRSHLIIRPFASICMNICLNKGLTELCIVFDYVSRRIPKKHIEFGTRNSIHRCLFRPTVACPKNARTSQVFPFQLLVDSELSNESGLCWGSKCSCKMNWKVDVSNAREGTNPWEFTYRVIDYRAWLTSLLIFFKN